MHSPITEVLLPSSLPNLIFWNRFICAWWDNSSCAWACSLLSLPSLSVLLPTGIFHLSFFSPINFSQYICSFLPRIVLSVFTGLSPIYIVLDERVRLTICATLPHYNPVHAQVKASPKLKSWGDLRVMEWQVWINWQLLVTDIHLGGSRPRVAPRRNWSRFQVQHPPERLSSPLQDCSAHLHGMRKGLEKVPQK